MSKPGPVSNYDFLCEHEKLNPNKAELFDLLVISVPAEVYAKWVQNFGSDGAAPFGQDDLLAPDQGICPTCRAHELELEERRRREDRDVAACDSRSIAEGMSWYLMSTEWLRLWHNFKKGGKTVLVGIPLKHA